MHGIGKKKSIYIHFTVDKSHSPSFPLHFLSNAPTLRLAAHGTLLVES